MGYHTRGIAQGFAATGLLAASIAAAMPAPARAAEAPGPSKALFAKPYYACTTNLYVATTGSDSNDGTTPGTAWATLQHANDSVPTAGTCINVAPGTYTHGVLISHGGNQASHDGYVVYRCTALDSCIVTDVAAGGSNGAFAWNTTHPMTANYVMIDGFRIAAASTTGYGQGIDLWDGNDSIPTATTSVHHVWILNSIISGYGQSGVQMNDGEYFYVLHNTIFNNSRAGCSAQGSGISFAALKAFSNYTRVPADASNRMVGDIGSFNNAIEYNIVYNNAITECGTKANPYDTDGNDIIIDTLNNAGGTNVTYPGSVLVAYNITYASGGAGIHIFRSENTTVANNSCYNGGLDPYNNGSYRPCIGLNLSYNVTMFNNIGFGIAGAGIMASNNAFVGGHVAGATADSFSTNISYCLNNPSYGCASMYNGDSFSCSSNLCNVNPNWVSVGKSFPGTETSPPVNSNFALAAGSPAIGHGARASYLPASSVDIGACASSLTSCGPTQ